MDANNGVTLGGTLAFPGTKLSVRRLGYGAMQLAGPGVWGPPRDEASAIAVLREAVALGINHIDTSDFYGPHTTNQLIHKALHPYPADVVLVTKVGYLRDNKRGWIPSLSGDQLVGAVESNLRNLGIDSIPIVNLRVGGAHGPEEGSIEAPLLVLLELQERGLLQEIGVSNVTAKQVAQAREFAEVVCVQNEYNLTKRTDDALIDELAAAGIAYTSYFPLGGFTPLQSGILDEVAHEVGATPMQVALAWQLHRAPNLLLIPGTKSVQHLRENVQAADLKLGTEALQKLDAIALPA